MFPRFAATVHMTDRAARFADRCWRLEFSRLNSTWFKSKTLWPHVQVRLWNGRVAQHNTRIVAVMNDYDRTGQLRWFAVIPKHQEDQHMAKKPAPKPMQKPKGKKGC